MQHTPLAAKIQWRGCLLVHEQKHWSFCYFPFYFPLVWRNGDRGTTVQFSKRSVSAGKVLIICPRKILAISAPYSHVHNILKC